MFLGNLYDDDLNYAADGLPCELFDKKSVFSHRRYRNDWVLHC